MTATKQKDDELLIWVIVGSIFTIFLLVIDFFYSSVGGMALVAKICIGIGHAILAYLWVVSLANWKDPNYDVIRKCVVYVAVILALIVGIHHATSREDKQVIIDSHENAAK